MVIGTPGGKWLPVTLMNCLAPPIEVDFTSAAMVMPVWLHGWQADWHIASAAITPMSATHGIERRLLVIASPSVLG